MSHLRVGQSVQTKNIDKLKKNLCFDIIQQIGHQESSESEIDDVIFVGENVRDENHDTPRKVKEIPQRVFRFQGAWAWITSKKFPPTFCGIRKKPELFLQLDTERDAAVHCISSFNRFLG